MLSQKAAEGKLKVVESWEMPQPKTKLASAQLERFGAASAVVIDVSNDALCRCRTCRRAAPLPSAGLNVRDLVHYDHVIVMKEAIERSTERCSHEHGLRHH